MAKLQLHFNGSFAFKKEEIGRILPELNLSFGHIQIPKL